MAFSWVSARTGFFLDQYQILFLGEIFLSIFVVDFFWIGAKEYF